MPRLTRFAYDRWADKRFDEWVADRPTLIAFDTETTGLAFHDRAFAATLTWRRNDGSLQSAYLDLEEPGYERRIQILRDMLVGTGQVVAHNAKFDQTKALLMGALSWSEMEQIEWHDTQTIYALLDENSTKGLKELAVRVLHYDDTISVPYKSGPKKGQTRQVPKEKHQLDEARRALKLTKADGYHLLPREVLIPYALRDTEFTLLLYEALMPRLRALNDPRLLKLYEDSMRLKLVLLRMEADGFALDIPYLEQIASEYGVRVMEKWDRVVSLVGDPEFNPRSPAQVQDAFAHRGVALDNTQEKTLLGLDDELAAALLDYRSDFKMHQTYLTGLLREQKDGIVHPHFNAEGARTGRMSSGSATE